MSKAVTTAQRALLVRAAGRLSTTFVLQKRATPGARPAPLTEDSCEVRASGERKDDEQQSVQISLSHLVMTPTHCRVADDRLRCFEIKF